MNLINSGASPYSRANSVGNAIVCYMFFYSYFQSSCAEIHHVAVCAKYIQLFASDGQSNLFSGTSTALAVAWARFPAVHLVCTASGCA